MPPNTTSLIQPLDQGIIRAAKVHYRTQVVRKLLHALEDGTSIIDYAKSIDLLQALHMLKRAWFLVSPTTIENCFRKAGFSKNGDADEDTDDGMEELDTADLGKVIQPEEFDAYVDCDKDVECFGSLTDAEICETVKTAASNSEEYEEEDEDISLISETTPRVSHKEASKALETVRKYLEENFVDYDAYYRVEEMIEKNTFKNATQRKLTDFFAQEVSASIG